MIANDYIAEVEHPTCGTTKNVGIPIGLSETPASIRSVAPQFGQHTEEVLSEVLGYDWEHIGALREDGVL